MRPWRAPFRKVRVLPMPGGAPPQRMLFGINENQEGPKRGTPVRRNEKFPPIVPEKRGQIQITSSDLPENTAISGAARKKLTSAGPHKKVLSLRTRHGPLSERIRTKKPKKEILDWRSRNPKNTPSEGRLGPKKGIVDGKQSSVAWRDSTVDEKNSKKHDR